MTAKEYLKRYDRLRFEIQRLEETLSEVRSMAYSVGSPKSDGMPRGTGGGDLSGVIGKINSIELKIDALKNDAVFAMADIEDIISRVDDERFRLILTLRYLNRMTWHEIAEEMNYSEQHVYWMHGEALKRVQLLREKKS